MAISPLQERLAGDDGKQLHQGEDMRKRIKRIITVGLSAVAVTAATQGPAAASDRIAAHPARDVYCNDYAGVAYFDDRGEDMEVKDSCKDGNDIFVRWKYELKNGKFSLYHHIHYTGGTRDLDGEEYNLDQWWDHDDDLPEGRDFCFQVGLVNTRGEYVWGSWGNPKCTTTG